MTWLGDIYYENTQYVVMNVQNIQLLRMAAMDSNEFGVLAMPCFHYAAQTMAIVCAHYILISFSGWNFPLSPIAIMLD